MSGFPGGVALCCSSCQADDHGGCPAVIHVLFHQTPAGTWRGGTFVCGCVCRDSMTGERWLDV